VIHLAIRARTTVRLYDQAADQRAQRTRPGAGGQPYGTMSMKHQRSESPPPSPPPPALMEVGAPATTTHTAMLVVEAKKECKKGELRRVKAELQDVQRRHEVVERELWQLESQAHAWYAKEGKILRD
jgi:hypothetical protein